MSDSIASLWRNIGTADGLRSVVCSMKALANFTRSVEVGLCICLNRNAPIAEPPHAWPRSR